MPHPFFDAITYPWPRADARAWHTALYENIKIPARIDVLYQTSGPGLAPLPTPPAPPDVIWKAALEQLSAARKLESLCTFLLKDASLNSVHKAVQAVLDAESFGEQVILETEGLPDLAFVNRKNLRIELDKLASSSPTVRVLLIRGDPKSGRTWTRHLVERKASELGEGPIIYVFDGNVATANNVMKAIFSALGKPNAIPPQDSSEPAWWMDVLYKVAELADVAKRHLWIVADDLGEDSDGPKLDPTVRRFFEQFALFMANPAFAQWFRLVLIEYPRGPVPTKWKKGFWVEEDTNQSPPQSNDLTEFLLQWAKKKKKNLPQEQAQKFAAEVLTKAQSASAPGGAVWEAIHEELLLVMKTL